MYCYEIKREDSSSEEGVMAALTGLSSMVSLQMSSPSNSNTDRKKLKY